jgi:hypothetical protein
MNKNISYILKLAELFETKSLVKLAKTDIHHSFYHKLSAFINSKIDPQVLDSWIEKNSSVLNASSALSVSGYPNKDYIEFPLPNNKWARIYKTLKEHDNFVIDKSFYLAGTGNIPNLWLYIGATLDTDESKFNIDLGHNEFLFEAFKDMFASEWKLMSLTNPGRFVREIQLFYNQNKNKINNLRRLFDGQPKKLGAGADGVAFALSSTLVLKIFKTELTYKHALQALKRLHENPDLPN